MQKPTTIPTTVHFLNFAGDQSAVCKLFKRWELVEAAIGIEPMDKGFADLCLTTWLRRLVCQTKGEDLPLTRLRPSPLKSLERETGFEPATSTLARSHSTAELLPLGEFDSIRPKFALSTKRP